MSLPDDQIARLDKALKAAKNVWQPQAAGEGILIQQIIFEFQPDSQTNFVLFQWNGTGWDFSTPATRPQLGA